MNRKFLGITLFLLLVLLVPLNAQAVEKSRYATLRYSDMRLVRDFNDNLILGRKLSYYMGNKKIVTVEDEVLAKLDIIIEKAEVVLDMFPAGLHISFVLLASRDEVASMYMQKYGKKSKHISYYSLQEDTIYISVDDTSLRVISHEIGHAIVDHYFQVRPPYNVHELMAQFVEKHIVD